MCAYVGGYVHANAEACRQEDRGLNPLELELRVIIICLST